MKVAFSKKYLAAYIKVKDNNLKSGINNAIKNIYQANNIMEIRNLKKMKGYKTFYRIRIGTYRIGVNIQSNTVCIVSFGPRKNFYKKFP